MHVRALIVFGLFAQFSGAESQNYLDLDLKQDRYLGEVQHSAQTSNYTIFSGHLGLEKQTYNIGTKLEAYGQGTFEEQSESYFGVPEAYFQPRRITRGMASELNFTMGRQRRDWSRLDQEFNLGVWQPQLRWDYLDPIQQGLTGLFVDWRLSPSLKATIFTSPFFLPDQGPQFRLRDGQFESANRWFVQPQSQVALFGDTPFATAAPLYFELDRPSEQEVILQTSVGGSVRYEVPGGPYWTQFSYAYKPRNQLHLGIECANCANVGGPTPLEITAKIHPVVVKHHVASLETGFLREEDRGYVSLAGDFPERSDFPAEYEESSLNSAAIAGAVYERFIGQWVQRPSWIKLSYMRSFEIERKTRRGLVERDEVQSSLDRYPFQEVGAVDWSVRFAQKRRQSWLARARYTYSIPERGGWLSPRLEWLQDSFSIYAGADILGAEVDPNSSKAGLFSRYRANDRVVGGLSYVF